MSALRLSRASESQVDPFNAGEPELPWDDPEPLEEGEGVSYAPHGDPDGTPHKSDDNYQAPTTGGHSYDAPSTHEPRRRRRAARRAEAREAEVRGVEPRGLEESPVSGTSRLAARLRAVVAVVVTISILGSLASFAGALLSEGDDDPAAPSGLSDVSSTVSSVSHLVSNGDDDGPAGDEDADALAAREALGRRLEELLADPSGGEAHELLAGYLDDKLLSLTGYTCSELGVDPDAWATSTLERTSFSLDSAYVYGDEATAYAYLSAPDANSFVWDFYGSVSSYLSDNGLWGDYGYGEVALPDEGQRAHLASAFDEALGRSEAGEGTLVSAYLTRGSDGWVVDEQDLASSLESALGAY